MANTFTYTNPKAFYDEKNDQYFIKGFGGKKKYFTNEQAYDSFVKLDRDKKYKKFLQEVKDANNMAKRGRGLFGQR